MRTPTKLLAIAVALGALAVAGAQLLPREQPPTRPVEHVENDLCIVAPATPYDPASGLDMLDPRPIPAEARCPVCGMYPARNPRWAAQVIFKDGAAHFFDSPADLFAFLRDVARRDRNYAGEDVAMTFVTDFESGQWTEAGRAFFVHGSTLVGPMRDADLPAFASREAADTLAAQRGGRVLRLAELTPEIVQSLNRNVHHRH